MSLVDDKIGPVYGEFPHGAMSPLDGGLPAFPYTRQVGVPPPLACSLGVTHCVNTILQI